MASNKLQVLENTVPLKAHPGIDEVLQTVFKFWLAKLLSIKAENEEKLDDALPFIKEQFWSLGLKDVKKAFTMYVKNELNIKPISNHIDIILVGQIFKEYKQTQRTQPTKMNETEYKKQEDDLKVIQCYDAFVQDRKIKDEFYWVYTYLEHQINATDKDKKVLYKMGLDQKMKHEQAIQRAKVILLRRYFENIEAKGKHIKEYL